MNLDKYIGLENLEEKIVVKSDSASVYGSGLVDVFSTPAMIAFAEYTCMNSVAKLLPDGFSTVGTHVNISHEKATPIGDTVKCKCKLQNIDRRKLVFVLEITDSEGVIGKGTHERFIIDVNKFVTKLK
ncbi:MAG: thioesterase family protein [Bacteroidales bacterium]|nr:thioesterase family protein [Bacteroidales bacterium]